jgi:hypothetical protein
VTAFLCAGFFLLGALAGWLLRRFFYPPKTFFLAFTPRYRRHSLRRRNRQGRFSTMPAALPIYGTWRDL